MHPAAEQVRPTRWTLSDRGRPLPWAPSIERPAAVSSQHLPSLASSSLTTPDWAFISYPPHGRSRIYEEGETEYLPVRLSSADMRQGRNDSWFPRDALRLQSVATTSPCSNIDVQATPPSIVGRQSVAIRRAPHLFARGKACCDRPASCSSGEKPGTTGSEM